MLWVPFPFSLFLHKNICSGYQLAVPHPGTSNEYPQDMFSWRSEWNLTWIPLLPGAMEYITWWSYIAHLSKQICILTIQVSAKLTALRFLYKFYVQEWYGPIKWSSNAVYGKQCLIFFFFFFEGSIFPQNRHFFFQERFNKLIYGINTIIKCGTWQPVKFQLDSRSWNEIFYFFFIISMN